MNLFFMPIITQRKKKVNRFGLFCRAFSQGFERPRALLKKKYEFLFSIREQSVMKKHFF